MSTFFTTLFKFIFAISFVIPVLLFELTTAITIGIIWGVLLLSTFSFVVARKRKENPYHAIIEHVLIAAIVIVITYFVRTWISTWAV